METQLQIWVNIVGKEIEIKDKGQRSNKTAGFLGCHHWKNSGSPQVTIITIKEEEDMYGYLLATRVILKI